MSDRLLIIYYPNHLTVRYLLYFLIILLAAIQGVTHLRRLKPEFKLLTVLLAATFVCEAAGRFLAIYIKTSFPAYHVLIPIQFILYPFIYLHFLNSETRVAGFILISAAALALLSILNSIFIQPLLTFPSNGVLALSLLIIAVVLFTSNRMVMNPSRGKLIKEPLFWFNTGNLVFYTITFLIFGFFSPLRKLGIMMQEWEYTVIWVSNIVLYGCYWISLNLAIKSTD